VAGSLEKSDNGVQRVFPSGDYRNDSAMTGWSWYRGDNTADAFFRVLAQARVDHTPEILPQPDLLILDDFGMQKLTTQQSTDINWLLSDTASPVLSPQSVG